MESWWIYTGSGQPHDRIDDLPPPPPWRDFKGEVEVEQDYHAASFFNQRLAEAKPGSTYQASPDEVEIVNAALYLRRPLLITGKPGSGKSSLPYAVAHELKLGPVLRWPITTKTTLADGLYRYDAIARLQDASLNKDKEGKPDIGRYIRLGPIGTALLPSSRPRVLLIDEIDKSDIDFPNDLLNVFEEGEFEIRELARLPEDQASVDVLPHDGDYKVTIKSGRIRCQAFPFVVLTSNDEREFPPAFLRRCLRFDIKPPDRNKLMRIVESHLGADALSRTEQLIDGYLRQREKGDIATDQLLNAIYLTMRGIDPNNPDKSRLFEAVLRYLNVRQ